MGASFRVLEARWVRVRVLKLEMEEACVRPDGWGMEINGYDDSRVKI